MSHLRFLTAAAVLGLLALPAIAETDVPLRHWVSPIYWSPAAPEPDETGNAKWVPMSTREALAASAPLPFVAITPCRIADTRDGSYPAGYGPPQLSGGGAARTFVIPSGPCPGIPSSAGAYSLNFTVVAPGGTPPGGYLSLWPAGAPQPVVSTLNFTSGSILANAAIVPAGTGGGINLFVNFSTDLIIDINGYYAGTGLVTSVNALTGDLTLAGGGGVTLSTAGNTLTINGPTPSGSMTIGQPGDTTLLGSGYTETWPAGMDSWVPMSTTNAPPNLARGTHCSVWTGSKLFVWGGQDIGYIGLNTGGVFDPTTNTWTPTTTSGAPSARRYPHCVWSGSKVVVWSGEESSAANVQVTGGRYDLVGDSWAAMSTSGAPAGRITAAVVWSGSRMVVWGGLDRSGGGTVYTYPGAGGRYDPVGDVWTGISTTSQPTPRSGPAYVWTGSQMIVWGGYTGPNTALAPHNTGGRYDPVADTWQDTTVTNAPSARWGNVAVWTGSRMIVWAGASGSSPTWVSYNNGALYDPVGNAWTAMAMAGAPSARTAPTVWTGSRMIAWGGVAYTGSTTTTFNTGGVYDPAANRWVAATTTVNAPSARYAHQMIWTGSPLNEMLVIGPDNAGYVYRPLSMYVKN